MSVYKQQYRYFQMHQYSNLLQPLALISKVLDIPNAIIIVILLLSVIIFFTKQRNNPVSRRSLNVQP
jgi:hypothetical protein